MQSNDVPTTTAASSSGNIVAPTAASASGNAPTPAPSAPQDEPRPHKTDMKIVVAIGLINQLPRTLQAKVKDASETRKAEIESWIEDHQEEMDDRIKRLCDFTGFGIDLAESADLRRLLRPYPVPVDLLRAAQPSSPEASGSKRKHPDSPAEPMKKGKAAAKGDDAEEQVEAESSTQAQGGKVKDEDACGAVVFDAANKRYVELRCNICHTNISKDNKFLKGIRGFQTHYRHIHDETLKPQEIVERFNVRTFTEDQAKQVNKPGGPVVDKHEPVVEAEGEQVGPLGAAGGENDDEDEE